MNKRAITDEEKATVIDRLYQVWKSDRCKSMRLGQLIQNVYPYPFRADNKYDDPGRDKYNVEDYDLIDEIETFYEDPATADLYKETYGDVETELYDPEQLKEEE